MALASPLQCGLNVFFLVPVGKRLWVSSIVRLCLESKDLNLFLDPSVWQQIPAFRCWLLVTSTVVTGLGRLAIPILLSIGCLTFAVNSTSLCLTRCLHPVSS